MKKTFIFIFLIFYLQKLPAAIDSSFEQDFEKYAFQEVLNGAQVKLKSEDSFEKWAQKDKDFLVRTFDILEIHQVGQDPEYFFLETPNCISLIHRFYHEEHQKIFSFPDAKNLIGEKCYGDLAHFYFSMAKYDLYKKVELPSAGLETQVIKAQELMNSVVNLFNNEGKALNINAEVWVDLFEKKMWKALDLFAQESFLDAQSELNDLIVELKKKQKENKGAYRKILRWAFFYRFLAKHFAGVELKAKELKGLIRAFGVASWISFVASEIFNKEKELIDMSHFSLGKKGLQFYLGGGFLNQPEQEIFQNQGILPKSFFKKFFPVHFIF